MTGGLGIARGRVKEFKTIEALAADLTKCGVFQWWKEGMEVMNEEQKELEAGTKGYDSIDTFRTKRRISSREN